MRILLVSTYELGHQPVHVASPAAALRARGHEVRALDVSVQPFERALVDWADRIAFSVPMHTAMRMALPLAAAARTQRPGIPVCLYGLYGAMAPGATAAVADLVIAGEYEPALVDWADGGDPGSHGVVVHIGRSQLVTPARDLLPPLESYARLVVGEQERLAGAVEASHGCAHKCRHCPLPVVYSGRFRAAPEDIVLADVSQLVSMGARHVSFADPDFFNGPRHAVRVAEAVHSSFPELSFDCTVKVEHIIAHGDLWETMARAGCLFVVSAFESADDTTLEILDKGHRAADESAAVALLRLHGIEVRPSWLPFTPWAKGSELAAMLDFVLAHDLVGNVDAVQYTIRLLIPEGSLLLSAPQVLQRLGPFDDERLSWTWTAEEPGLDELQEELAALVETAASGSGSSGGEELFSEVRERVLAHLLTTSRPERGPDRRPGWASRGPAGPRPRLSEPWFCCSEPTSSQRAAVSATSER